MTRRIVGSLVAALLAAAAGAEDKVPPAAGAGAEETTPPAVGAGAEETILPAAGAGIEETTPRSSGTAVEEPAPRQIEFLVGTGEGLVPEVLPLTHRFLLDGSEVVRRGDVTLRREADYRLDPDAGVLQLAVPLARGERLEVSYRWVPLEIPREFVGLVREEPTPAESSRVAPPRDLAPAGRRGRGLDSDLSVGGAKTVSIEAGSNRDAAVEQSLRVRVTGRLGEDVRVTALLSDQNIPLQPEGNTRRLEELDEVLVKIEGKGGAATLGDFVAERHGSAFGDFERRLSGAEASLVRGPAQVRGVGASTRGTFRSTEFRGVEGKQGPYLLAGSGPVVTGVITAGSERVWLDGRLLERGEIGDYVMDYSRGELEFTNRVLITADSEIAVDFEIAEQPYDRSFLMGETAIGTPRGPVSFRTGIATETDDRDPRDLVLSAERRAALEAAGDAPVLVPGAVCGLDDGDYEPEGDHFVWVGPDSGSCEVSFTYVGPGTGDYARDRDADRGLVFFRFVGAGGGDYTPGLSLAPPQQHVLADAGLTIAGPARLTLQADGAYSDDDRNTLSSVDDGDNRGAAGRAVLGWESPELARWGGPVTLRAGGTFRGEQAEFAPLGRTRDAYLGEVWNFADTTRADETVSEGSLALGAGNRWSVGGTLGQLDRAGRFRSERREGSASWTGRRIPTARLRLEQVRREDDADSAGTVVGDLRRERAEVGGALGLFRPGLTWWREDRENVRGTDRLSGEDAAELGGSLGVGTRLRADVRFARRTTDVVDDGNWVRDSVGRTIEVHGEAPGRSARARVSWIRRTLDFEAGRLSADRTTNLARADLSHESFGGLVSGEWVYETTSRFFTDLLAAPGEVARPTLALEASGRVVVGGRGTARRWTSADGKSQPNPLRWIRAETTARVEEETTTPDRGRIYRLDLSRFRDDEYTIFGQLLLREEVTLFPEAGAFSLTGRWERTDTKDNRAAASRLDLVSERRILRARNRLDPRWTLESQGTWQRDSRGDARAGTTDFDIILRELEEELSWQPNPAARLTGTGALVAERDEARGASIRGLVGTLAVQSSVRRNGRARAELSWTHPSRIEGVDLLRRFRTREDDELEWRGSIELKASESIHVSVSYSGRVLQGEPALHLARAEARALF